MGKQEKNWIINFVTKAHNNNIFTEFWDILCFSRHFLHCPKSFVRIFSVLSKNVWKRVNSIEETEKSDKKEHFFACFCAHADFMWFLDINVLRCAGGKKNSFLIYLNSCCCKFCDIVTRYIAIICDHYWGSSSQRQGASGSFLSFHNGRQSAPNPTHLA